MANEQGFAGTIVKINGVPVALVTGFTKNSTMAEIDVTGAEDVSGDLVHERFKTVSLGQTLDLEGITVQGSGAEYEPGQQDLFDAGENGTEVVITSTKPSGYGWDYTGYFTSIRESGAVKDVYKWSGSFRVNSKVAVTP